MTNPEALAPCPFCGGDAEIYSPPIRLGDDDADVDYLRVVCKCRVIGGLFRFTNHDRKSADYLSARNQAITAWNQRASPDVAKIVAWLRGEADEHAKDEAHNEADTVRNIASCIERGDWK